MRHGARISIKKRYQESAQQVGNLKGGLHNKWMLFNSKEEAHRRIFQSQLHALLKRGTGLGEAIAQIEGKALAGLRAKISKARAGADDPAALIRGLVGEALLSPEMAIIAESAKAHQINLEDFLREHLRKEVDFHRVQGAILAPIYRVVFTFVPMFLFFSFVYLNYKALAYPQMIKAMGEYEMMFSQPKAWVYLYLFSLFLLAVFSGFVVSMFLALKFNRTENRKALRFLWIIPGISRLFRKRITWRIFTRCQLLLRAGLAPATAMAESLRSSGLQPAGAAEAPGFPSSKLLDSVAVEAANLGASLDTLGAQLDESVDLLERELPNTAEAVARVLYYTGYLMMALMVCSMLVQMYAPYFHLYQMFLQEGP